MAGDIADARFEVRAVMTDKIKFKDLEIGDEFEVYGDYFLNYKYPKICKCVKTDADAGKEIDGGMRFLVSENDMVRFER